MKFKFKKNVYKLLFPPNPAGEIGRLLVGNNPNSKTFPEAPAPSNLKETVGGKNKIKISGTLVAHAHLHSSPHS